MGACKASRIMTAATVKLRAHRGGLLALYILRPHPLRTSVGLLLRGIDAAVIGTYVQHFFALRHYDIMAFALRHYGH